MEVQYNNGPVEVLSKIINLMRDLLKFSQRHNIEDKLFCGDGLNRIYRLIDGNRRRKWLEIASDFNEGEDQWNRLITFLEKELKVSQQDAIIMTMFTPPKSDPNKKNRPPSYYTDEESSDHQDTSEACPKNDKECYICKDHVSYYADEGLSDHQDTSGACSKNNKECYICGDHDHVQTNGPGGMKVVQYFSCKTFSDWQNVERFQYLKSKGYCVQCLYPGADQKMGKHKDGRCQRDYVCRHLSHGKFTIKKHVLVCEEHKDGEENKETLKKFKDRFILRVKDLPEHAKNIQLSHYVMSPKKVEPQSTEHTSCMMNATSELPSTSIEQEDLHLMKRRVRFDISPDVPEGTLVKPTRSYLSVDEAKSSATPEEYATSVEQGASYKSVDEVSPLTLPGDGEEKSTIYMPQPIEIGGVLYTSPEEYAALVEQDASYTSVDKVGPLPPPDDDREESAIYMLQTIEIDSELYTIFYDSGCMQFVCRYSAVTRLGVRAIVEQEGPTGISGVGGISMETPHGIYKVKLPLNNGHDATLTGVCLDQITQTFPVYPLKGEVEQDIRVAFHHSGGNLRQLPNLPECVGGDVAFMFGIQYNRYFPTEIFRLPSGLSIYKSRFKNPDGSDGVIGGSHRIFTEIESQHHMATSSFLANQLRLFQGGYVVNPDVTLLGYREFDDACHEVGKIPQDDDPKSFYTPLKIFKEAEEAGSEITYRCVKCRSCKECKNHERNKALSIKEEVEEDVINRSVIVNVTTRETIASLPCMADPKIKLAPNRFKAEKTYQQQLERSRRQEMSPKGRECTTGHGIRGLGT